MNDVLVLAIKSRRVIHFYYKKLHRVVEPFCYGVSKKGEEVLRARQVGGHSDSGSIPGWRLFRVAEMVTVTVTEEGFDTDQPEYNPADPAMARIYQSA